MAAHDEDCYCEMPYNLSDEDLDASSRQQGPFDSLRQLHSTSSSPPTTGFLAFARLCRIASKIQQLNSPRRIRELASSNSNKARKFVARVAALDRSLRTWLESLPDDIRFSANTSEQNLERNPHLTMCAIIFIVHAGSLLNLYRWVSLLCVTVE